MLAFICFHVKAAPSIVSLAMHRHLAETILENFMSKLFILITSKRVVFCFGLWFFGGRNSQTCLCIELNSIILSRVKRLLWFSCLKMRLYSFLCHLYLSQDNISALTSCFMLNVPFPFLLQSAEHKKKHASDSLSVPQTVTHCLFPAIVLTCHRTLILYTWKNKHRSHSSYTGRE